MASCVVLCVIRAFLLLNVILGCVAVYFVISAYHCQTTNEKYSMCLSCSNCEKSSFSSLQNIMHRDGKAGVENSNDLKDVLKQIFEFEWEKSKQSVTVKEKPIRGTKLPSISFISLVKPMIHLQGLKPVPTGINETAMKIIGNWDDDKDSPLFLISGYMKHDHGFVTVPTRGLYQIYSHVTFTKPRNQNGRCHVFNHTVLRHNALTGTAEDLVNNIQFECETTFNRPFNEYVSYVSTTTSLNSGDTIYVKANNFQRLMEDKNRHYFGAYLIS